MITVSQRLQLQLQNPWNCGSDIVPALLNCGGADTLRPPPTADFGNVPGVAAFLRGLLPFSMGPSGPVQEPSVMANFLVLCLFFTELNERLLRSACLLKLFGNSKSWSLKEKNGHIKICTLHFTYCILLISWGKERKGGLQFSLSHTWDQALVSVPRRLSRDSELTRDKLHWWRLVVSVEASVNNYKKIIIWLQ